MVNTERSGCRNAGTRPQSGTQRATIQLPSRASSALSSDRSRSWTQPLPSRRRGGSCSHASLTHARRGTPGHISRRADHSTSMGLCDRADCAEDSGAPVGAVARSNKISRGFSLPRVSTASRRRSLEAAASSALRITRDELVSRLGALSRGSGFHRSNRRDAREQTLREDELAHCFARENSEPRSSAVRTLHRTRRCGIPGFGCARDMYPMINALPATKSSAQLPVLVLHSRALSVSVVASILRHDSTRSKSGSAGKKMSLLDTAWRLHQPATDHDTADQNSGSR